MELNPLLLSVGQHLINAYPNSVDAEITIAGVKLRYIFMQDKVVQITSIDSDGRAVNILYEVQT